MTGSGPARSQPQPCCASQPNDEDCRTSVHLQGRGRRCPATRPGSPDPPGLIPSCKHRPMLSGSRGSNPTMQATYFINTCSITLAAQFCVHLLRPSRRSIENATANRKAAAAPLTSHESVSDRCSGTVLLTSDICFHPSSSLGTARRPGYQQIKLCIT